MKGTQPYIYIYPGFPSGSVVKNLPAMPELQESWVWSLGWEDPWRRARQSTHVLAWRIPWTEDPGGLQSLGYGCSDHVHACIHASILPETSLPSRLGGVISDLLRKRSTGPMVSWFTKIFKEGNQKKIKCNPNYVSKRTKNICSQKFIWKCS